MAVNRVTFAAFASGMNDTRTMQLTESPAVPGLSLFLGFGAMIPLAAGAILAWALSGTLGDAIHGLTLIWGSAILLFLSGVRRGLSFRTPQGETAAEIATMLWLFALGLAAVLLIPRTSAAIALVIGYLSIAVLDPIAARRSEAPLFFARLRPVQMAIPIVSLLALAFR